jgi:tRNA nucleotidyltransferase (CCA-adding enzyme)
MSPDIPDQPDALALQTGLATAIAAAVRERGGRALLVGGCVRDQILGRAPKDLDMEVFGLEGTALRALLDGFGRVDVVGESFLRLQSQRPRRVAAAPRVQDRPRPQGLRG